MHKSYTIILVILIICLTVLIVSCPQPKQDVTRNASVSEEDIEAGGASVTYKQALVIFASGDVQVKGEADWQKLEIGSIVFSGETVKVGTDSLCELQFAEKSVIRIQENTEILINNLWLEPDKTSVDFDLVRGWVLCKVSKLVAEESFKVRSSVMVCSVRGTEFMVRIVDPNKTCVAVKEGEVAVLPASAGLERIYKELQFENLEIQRLVKGIDGAALMVSARQETTLGEPDTERAEHLVEAMALELKKADKKEKLTREELKTVTAFVSETKAKIHKLIGPAAEISVQKEEELEVLDKVEIKKIKIVPDKTQATAKKDIKALDKDDKEKGTATVRQKPGKGHLDVSAKERGELYIDGAVSETIDTQQEKIIIVDAGNHSVEMRYANGKEEMYDVVVRKGSTEKISFTYDMMQDLVFLKDININSKDGKGFRFVAESDGYYRFMYKKGAYNAWPAGKNNKNCVYVYKNQKVNWVKGLEDKLWPSQPDYQIGKNNTIYESLESAGKDAAGDYFDVYLSKNDYLIFMIEDAIESITNFGSFSDNNGSITLSVYLDKIDDHKIE